MNQLNAEDNRKEQCNVTYCKESKNQIRWLKLAVTVDQKSGRKSWIRVLTHIALEELWTTEGEDEVKIEEQNQRENTLQWILMHWKNISLHYRSRMIQLAQIWIIWSLRNLKSTNFKLNFMALFVVSKKTLNSGKILFEEL